MTSLEAFDFLAAYFLWVCVAGFVGYALLRILAARIYARPEISERHRHRYEVNNEYRDVFRENGLRLSGLSPDHLLVEIIELPTHPWFLATQFHPELKSRPTHPHPIFASFIKAALKRMRERKSETGELEVVGVEE